MWFFGLKQFYYHWFVFVMVVHLKQLGVVQMCLVHPNDFSVSFFFLLMHYFRHFPAKQIYHSLSNFIVLKLYQTPDKSEKHISTHLIFSIVFLFYTTISSIAIVFKCHFRFIFLPRTIINFRRFSHFFFKLFNKSLVLFIWCRILVEEKPTQKQQNKNLN